MGLQCHAPYFWIEAAKSEWNGWNPDVVAMCPCQPSKLDCIIYSIYAFSTIYLYSLQIAAERLIEWTAGAILSGASASLIPEMNMPHRSSDNYTENIFIRVVKTCFVRYYGVDVYRKNHHNEEWLGSHGGAPHLAYNMGIWPLILPPFFVNPLDIDNYLVIRPLEWGVTTPYPVASFSQEVVLTGPQQLRGCFAFMEDGA